MFYKFFVFVFVLFITILAIYSIDKNRYTHDNSNLNDDIYYDLENFVEPKNPDYMFYDTVDTVQNNFNMRPISENFVTRTKSKITNNWNVTRHNLSKSNRYNKWSKYVTQRIPRWMDSDKRAIDYHARNVKFRNIDINDRAFNRLAQNLDNDATNISNETDLNVLPISESE